MGDFVWASLLDVIAPMIENGNGEDDPLRQATLRIVASRAYYAAFNTARTYVQRRFPQQQLPAHGAVHEVVAGLLKTSKGVRREERAIGEYLKRLKALRTTADYESRRGISEDDARSSVETARRTTKLLAMLEEQLR